MSARIRHKTHLGKEFNMSAFAEKNSNARAIGNTPMNARGDVLDAKGNVKIPTQQISRVLADIKNNESKKVSLKADETITPVQHLSVVPDEKLNVVGSKDVETDNGTMTEIEYADGSMELVPKKI